MWPLFLFTILAVTLTLWNDSTISRGRKQVSPLLNELVRAPCEPSDLNNGKVVYITCELGGGNTFYAPKEFSSNIYSFTGAYFETRVEMYQWVDAPGFLGTYKVGKFIDHIVENSTLGLSLFQQFKNPTFFPHVPGSGRKFPTKLKIGGYIVPSGALGSVTHHRQLSLTDDQWYQASPLTYPLPVAEISHLNTQVHDNALYTGDPLAPRVGDLRITFWGSDATTFSVIGRQTSSIFPKEYSLEPVQLVDERVVLLQEGLVSPMGLLNQLLGHYETVTCVTWGLRVASLILLAATIFVHYYSMRAPKPGLQEMLFAGKQYHKVKIFSILDGESGNKPGFQDLKKCLELIDSGTIVRVLVAGGDGTVVWAISEVEAHSIDYNRVAFGVLPYGTGNDFARVINWRGFSHLNPFIKSLEPLRNVVDSALQADVVPHDIWSVHLVVDEQRGSFRKINSKTRQEETCKGPDNAELRQMHLVMCNYFSIGVDGRIGRNFDRRRSTRSFINKCVYVWEGMKKSFISKVHVNKQIQSITKNGQTVFTTEPGDSTIPLLGSSAVLLALNIPSYSAGLDSFGRSTKVALTNMAPMAEKELLQHKQKLGDGTLEFVSYRKTWHIGMDFIIRRMGRRVHASEGPWKIHFRDLDPKERVYFQVDGEFFVMHKPISVAINHAKTIKLLMLQP
ncbi:bifunctional Diacylglycerol kinase/Diacylglycerol kinase [Babesia duncani]|uniref:Diacylglycerol kinase n=1 Tax=Babesia duncani TaxID=323732 RepID=A0AAD9UPP7_9APIC|nr:bifunctional Diacylglycerol kinase/Diacylglycerol kinase [Babesia duncani]